MVVVYLLLNYVSVRGVYDAVDWLVIVLLGAMIPVGDVLQATGGADLMTIHADRRYGRVSSGGRSRPCARSNDDALRYHQ